MKAILVIEMPDSCLECQYTLSHICEGNRHKTCILKPMPMKRETHVYWKSVGIGNIPTHEISDYDKGWNDCVEFLEGELND